MKKLITILLSVMVVFTMSVSMAFADEVGAAVESATVTNADVKENVVEHTQFDNAVHRFNYDIKVKERAKEGDHFDLKISKEHDLMSSSTTDKPIDVVDEDGEVIGKVEIRPNEVSETSGGGIARVTFNDKVKNKVVKKINLTFYGMFNRFIVKANSGTTGTQYQMVVGVKDAYKGYAVNVIKEVESRPGSTIRVTREHDANANPEEAVWHSEINRNYKKLLDFYNDVLYYVHRWKE